MDECSQSVIQSGKTQLMDGGRGGGWVGGGTSEKISQLVSERIN